MTLPHGSTVIDKDLSFTHQEYDTRLKNIRSRMTTQGIDVLILSDPCNMYYATGYDAWSFYVNQCVLIGAGEGSPVWIGRQMDAHGAALTSIMSGENIVPYSDKYVQSDKYHPADVFAEEIKTRFGPNLKVGYEANSYYLDIRTFQKLGNILPDCTFTDASLLVNWVRAVKSEAEIAYHKQASVLVQNAMQAAREMIKPGVRECDVAGTIYKELMSSSPDFAGNYTSTPPLIPTGDRLNTPHLSWSSDTYKSEAQVNLELVACRKRYHTPLGRSLFLGKAPEALKTLESAIVDGLAAALDLIKPGVTAEEIEASWQAAASKYGVEKNARCGYSIGIAYPPTFGELTISLRPEDKTVMEPGMALHLMPAIWHEGRSIVITEPFYVTETGAETLCNFPRELFEIV